MRNVLLIGAGRSSTSLIQYLLQHATTGAWTITVADVSEESARAKIGNHPAGRAIYFDISDEQVRAKEIWKSDLVISMLPAHMHLPVAKECVRLKKHLVTASYVSKEMQDLDLDAKGNGVLLLNECGLDPGIDHMSAMKIIDELKKQGAVLNSFKSFTGGLVAPESNDNPWGYKFSWNPRNVILAGQGTARYIENGKYKYIPYNRLFANSDTFFVEGNGTYDGYANRDSLAYRRAYGLEAIPTLLRGTLRQEGYCKAWNIFVQLGLTDDSFAIEDSENLSYSQLVEAFLPNTVKGNSVRERVADLCGLTAGDTALEMVAWTGIFEDKPIGLPKATPAQILQQLLEEKWKLKAEDKDLIVMQHLFDYTLNGKRYARSSSLVVKGENAIMTAMAKTVGLPAAIAARLILEGKIKEKGVCIPVHPGIYEPVLNELATLGVSFRETTKELPLS